MAKWFCELENKYIVEIDIYGKIKGYVFTMKKMIKGMIDDEHKLIELYKNTKFCDGDKTCPICLSDEIYQVKLLCDHNVCVKCYCYAYDENHKCHYKCEGVIDFDDIKLIKIN